MIVTHSPIFIDHQNVQNNWIVEKNGKKTQIHPAKDLKEALEVVGAQPRDRLYPNKVLLVAGETEEDVLPIWLDKLEIDTNNVKITRLKGERDKRKVEVYHELAEGTQTNVFLIVDDHGAQLVKKAFESGVDPKNCLVLPGTIEDCYPPRILVDVMNDLFGLTLSTDDLCLDRPRLEEIKRILREQKNMGKEWWKRPLGKEIAKQMINEDIPADLRDFLKKLSAF